MDPQVTQIMKTGSHAKKIRTVQTRVIDLNARAAVSGAEDLH